MIVAIAIFLGGLWLIGAAASSLDEDTRGSLALDVLLFLLVLVGVLAHRARSREDD